MRPAQESVDTHEADRRGRAGQGCRLCARCQALTPWLPGDQIDSAGGFLRESNVTLLVGVQEANAYLMSCGLSKQLSLADPVRQPTDADHGAGGVLHAQPGRGPGRRRDVFILQRRAVRAHRLLKNPTSRWCVAQEGTLDGNRGGHRPESSSLCGVGRRLSCGALVRPRRLDLPRHRSRARKNVFTQIFSTLLVVLFFVPGVLLYLILRPKETLDRPSSARWKRSTCSRIWKSFRFALRASGTSTTISSSARTATPSCGTTATACGRLVDLDWTVCPYCAADQGKEAVAASITKVLGARAAGLSSPRGRPRLRASADGIRPSATAMGPAPRRMSSPRDERPALPPPQRTIAESPLPFTIVAGTPPRPATGRFRPQVRSTNGRCRAERSGC